MYHVIKLLFFTLCTVIAYSPEIHTVFTYLLRFDIERKNF